MTAEVLCTESDPLTLYWHFSPGSEQQQALILHEVPELKAPFICPTTCSRGIQQTATDKTSLIQVHIPLSINAPFMLSPLFMHPTQTPTSFPNTVSLPLASKALCECWCCSRTTHCIFQNSVFSQCGVGFWRGLYDLAVEMPLSSHLFNYLLPPHEPALLWTILPLQYLTYTNIKFYSPLLP